MGDIKIKLRQSRPIPDGGMKENTANFTNYIADAPVKFKASAEKMKWFIVDYFGEEKFVELHKLADEGSGSKIIDTLNMIWFALPDNRFNIIENPPGWDDLLNIVEF